MRRLVPLVLVALTMSAAAQKPFVVAPSKPNRDLKPAMLSTLSDPKTQVAIGVTESQRNLMEIRLAKDALNLGLDMMRAVARADDGGGVVALSTTFSNVPAKALYPYLTFGQVAKLRRLTLTQAPLSALVTEEVSFALSLTEAQRRRIDALYAARSKAYADPKRPSVRVLTAAFAALSKDAQRMSKEDDGQGVTVEKVDALRPYFARVFRAFETSARLSTQEPPVRTGDPLALLTPTQRRRYRDLARA